jgi:hypothetical protein
MDLKQAIASKLVSVEVSGANYDSIPVSMRNGFSPKMQMTVSNLSNQPVQLDLDPGYMLEAAEPGYQAMLLTQSVDLKLKPKERQRNYIYAMCTQLSKSGPNSSLHYHVAEKAKPSLLRMALFIASKKYLVHAAQEAVWSISDNLPIPSIDDKDPHITDELQKQVADIKHVNLDEVRKEYKKNKGAALAEFNGSKTDRNIPFDVKDTSVVAVAYYDLNGTPIKTIMKPTMLMQGKHSIRYEPYPVALAGQKYSVKMIKDGAPYKEYYFMQ